MKMHVRLLLKVASRYAPSRALSFNIAHVFKALQIIARNKHASRALLMKELGLGEGSIKTLLKHMRMHGLIYTDKKGSTLTSKGFSLYKEISNVIADECVLPRCSIAIGNYNYAVLLKGFRKAIRSGIEQRDHAIRIGALGATTLIYSNDKFMMPDSKHALINDEVYGLLASLKPEDNDAIIIGSADDQLLAELAAKYSALQTMIDYLNLSYI